MESFLISGNWRGNQRALPDRVETTTPSAAPTLSHPLDLFLGDKTAQGSGHRQTYGSSLGRPPTARDCAGRVVFSKSVEEVEGEHQLFSGTHRKQRQLTMEIVVLYAARIVNIHRKCIGHTGVPASVTHNRNTSWCF